MILSKKTVKYFLCQANLLDWQDSNKYTIKSLLGRNSNVYFLNPEKSFFLKQSLIENKGIQEGLLQEVYFYSWLKKRSNNFEFKQNFILFVGYESKNKIAVFQFQKNVFSLQKNDITPVVLDKMLSLIFCFHGVKWQNEFPIILKDKPDIWKLINEEPITSKLPKEWFEVRDKIRKNTKLTQLLTQLLSIWQPKSICNADIKLDNFLFENETKKIYWIDWERFCLADELWDVSGVLRMLFFENLREKGSLELVINSKIFQEQLSIVWKKTVSVNPDVSREKLFLLWIAAILEKTLELTQEGTISKKVAFQLIKISQKMYDKYSIIKQLFN